MDGEALQEKIKMLQAKYAEMLTQAAQEGRTDDVQTLSNQMQQEIQALINDSTQSAMSSEADASPAETNESEEDEDRTEEDREGDDEDMDGEEEDGESDEGETEDDDLEDQ